MQNATDILHVSASRTRTYLHHQTGSDGIEIVEEQHDVSVTCSDLPEHVGEDPGVTCGDLEELTV